MARRFHRMLFMLSIAALMQSCATSTSQSPAPQQFTPHLADCASQSRVAVTDFDKRIAARGFSVLPPSEGHWCRDTERRDAGHINFLSSPLLGTYLETRPTKEQYAHTFLTQVFTVNVTDTDISSQDLLKSFVERWLENGHGMTTIGDVKYADMSRPVDFTTIRWQVENEDLLSADCVRYEYESHQRNISQYGYPTYWVLRITAEAVACRHPDSKSKMIIAGTSERRRTGYEDPELAKEIQAQAVATPRSLEFLPL